MLADEYKLIFISLSAHIQPTEFYQLLLLSSASVVQSAAAPGWTLLKSAQQQALTVVRHFIRDSVTLNYFNMADQTHSKNIEELKVTILIGRKRIDLTIVQIIKYILSFIVIVGGLYYFYYKIEQNQRDVAELKETAKQISIQVGNIDKEVGGHTKQLEIILKRLP